MRQPPMPGKVLAQMFTTADSVLTEILAPGATGASDLFSDLRSNGKSGCPSFDYTSNSGHRVTADSVEMVDLSRIDADAIGWTMRAEADSRTTYIGTLLISDGDVLALLQMYSPSAISSLSIAALAEAQASRLRAVAG